MAEELKIQTGRPKFDAVILGMSSYFEDQVLALTLLKQEGAKKVIVKSGSPIQERILYRLGADEVIQVDLDVATRLARRLSLANIADIFEFKGSAIADDGIGDLIPDLADFGGIAVARQHDVTLACQCQCQFGTE